jgi:Kef-type K+ transport system membrane component KefB
MDFSQIAILLGGAAIAGVAAKLVKQPLIIGYLFAGYVLAVLGLIPEASSLEAMSKIGVALLLFLVGLEMNLKELPSIGKIAVITGLGQIIFTSTIGFLLATLLGFATLPAIYIAVALTFSSTIIIVKLLSEKNDLSSLYGRISVGFLLVQDLVAVLILMFLAGLGNGEFGLQNYLLIVVKGIGLLAVVWLLSQKVLPKVFGKIIDQSTELIFIVGIAWALGVAAFVGGPLGFSIEIGGFLAGLALSNLPDHLQISTRTRPLRDFFLTIFFLLLGTNLVVGGIGGIILPALIFSAFVLIGNPLIVLIIMGIMGYRKRTSFLASITVAQISEFSLILMAMGLTVGHLAESDVAMVVIVGVITMTLSTYMIMGSDRIYLKAKNLLSIFERKNNKEIVLPESKIKKNHIVMVGSHRTGNSLLPLFKKKDTDFVVVDFNPSLANELSISDTPVIFGDITDEDILSAANVRQAKLVISTTSDLHDNLVILDYLKRNHAKATTILKAPTRKEAVVLYDRGASYVIVPEVAAGEHIRHIIKTYGSSAKRIKLLGKSHSRRLATMK